MTLFYFALIASGIVLFFKDTTGLNRLYKAIDTYTQQFKVATFIYIGLIGMLLVPLDFIDLSIIGLYAMVYLFIGVIMYGLYQRKPFKALKYVSLLHVLGILGRLVVEWQSLTPLMLVNLLIYAAIIPLYIYIIQLVLTLNCFSSND
ncbi:hypothetical protein [Alkalibacterium sp. 20]|uniref:hypothetical protein n=1 Tax=Alkalibacterium sp. 20 TaxID=1798803 RepID=UPI0008FFE7BC|nr:hypothetical protein [Alkalibacterium sp. 20]OJF97011.1 hypothetical protein AX762_00140 [Alkalibacterium sp. 20]